MKALDPMAVKMLPQLSASFVVGKPAADDVGLKVFHDRNRELATGLKLKYSSNLVGGFANALVKVRKRYSGGIVQSPVLRIDTYNYRQRK